MVRVWDAVEAVNTKGEYGIISGRINDIAWDGDSQRIIAVGDGRERFGHWCVVLQVLFLIIKSLISEILLCLKVIILNLQPKSFTMRINIANP